MKQRLITSCLLWLNLALGQAETFIPTPSDEVLDNPHRGYMLWGSNVLADGGLPDNFHGASIYHVYLPWRMVETADQVFDWAGIEQTYITPIINDDPKATLVLRLVADYPDGPGSGINAHYVGGDADRDYPLFLEQAPLNIDRNAYASCNGDGPGVAPDWNDANFRDQATELVAAFGNHFDGDPRITAIQVGLLGLWGEWHQSGCDSIAPDDEVKNLVKIAYNNAFSQTPLQTRYARDPDVVNVDFGFHEDYFPSFTGPCIYDLPQCDDSGDWNLEYGMANIVPTARSNWQANPISGESPLNSQQNAWINDEADVTALINDYHFSFLGPAGKHEVGGNDVIIDRIANQLGYRFQITQINTPNPVNNSTVNSAVTINNIGSAPLYFSYQLAIDWVDVSNNTVATWIFDEDLSQLLPGTPLNLQQTFSSSLANGDYSMRMYLKPINSSARKIILANQIRDADGRLLVGSVVFNLTDLIFFNGFE
jgi:hypothetical protein